MPAMTALPEHPIAARLLERAAATLNRWIAASGAAREQARALEGRSLRLDVEHTGLRCRLSVADQRVRLERVAADGPADIVVRSGVNELLELARAGARQPLRAGEIEFRGSLRIAEQFAALLRLAAPSLEDELAGWIGGVPARAVARSQRAALQWLGQVRRSVERDVSEYLHFETRALPLRSEAEAQLRAVEQLRDDVDRLAQRLERLSAGPRR